LQGVVHDVTDLKEAEASARRLAVTDNLTGLANRSGLEERLRALINEHFNAQALGFALLMVNLDEFKRINEGMGLPAGDQILRTTAARLLNCVKRQDTVARLSADNFAVLLRDMTAGDEVDRVSRRIQEAVRQTFIVDGSPVNLHGSIGIALFPHDAEDLPTLLRQAELAMDSAKSAGGDTCVFFDPMLAESAERRRHLETDMRNALRNDEFTLYYQPIVDLDTNRLAGAEAPIRWRHPTRGLVAPDSFIPLAETTGLIVDIGLQVLDAACRQLAAWRAQGLRHYLSLNVSGRQIPDGLPPAALLQAVTRHGVPPESLALEITEGIMLRDVEKSRRWLSAVHEMGFRVYLDDFGTGYSSLSYLKQFPVDTLKIDKSFVRDMHTGSNEHTLVGAILAMAGSLGLDTVAEGVETADHVRALRALGCRHVQGYLFSRPIPAEDFIAASARIEELLADGISAG
jgi:diguanylate cyclase (GGDEF)-like protein